MNLGNAANMPDISSSSQHTSGKSVEWRTIFIASVGGGLEFYDFIVYGIFAPYIARSFFPSGSVVVSMIATFATFAVGYMARPLGGLVLSHIGDKFGRRSAFQLSLVTMTVTTAGMAFMPTYAIVGASASAAFVVLRFLQGACIGGELPGAIAYVVETAPGKSGLACGLMFACVNTGSLVAAIVSIVLHATLTEPDMLSIGWRIAFLIGGVLGAIGALMRRSLRETELFLSVKEKKRAKVPALEVVQAHLPQILMGIGIVGLNQALIAVLNVAMVPYLTQVASYSAQAASSLVMFSVAIMSVAIVLVGYLSDIIRKTTIYIAGAALIALGSYPFYTSIASKAIDPYVAFCLAATACSLISGTFGVLASELFPTRLRFSGLAISYNIAAALLGGFTPLLTSLLTRITGNSAAPGLFVSIVSVLGLISAIAILLKRSEDPAAVSPE
ncbi:MHS family MFS transporter [Paraburkholderia sp. Ac-20336]|uniref:MFS transporter n=1 Tax=Paraburkholderia sp. Ac-20336 TaxID=2703886 RepID=UPI00198245EA|nr:MFS transporter [Paraburkholderia sp. Ac-20336]MBN3803106.1 MHS family MFS transporter [Paraburkholderia sp. Ac-20336]